MIHESRLTSKGQTTIPVEIRDLLKAKPGDRLRYYVRDGQVILSAKSRSVMDLAGILKREGDRPMNHETMDDMIAEAISDHVMGRE